MNYWRERASGMSSLAYFMSKDTIDHFNTIVKPIVYLSMFYFFNNPRSSIWENYVVLLALVYCVTGIGYTFAIFSQAGRLCTSETQAGYPSLFPSNIISLISSLATLIFSQRNISNRIHVFFVFYKKKDHFKGLNCRKGIDNRQLNSQHLENTPVLFSGIIDTGGQLV
jgi:hypothetical protein